MIAARLTLLAFSVAFTDRKRAKRRVSLGNARTSCENRLVKKRNDDCIYRARGKLKRSCAKLHILHHRTHRPVNPAV